MKRLKIYLDTLIISCLDQKEKPERMADTHILWVKNKARMFDVVISDICIAEINGCNGEDDDT
ncbi:MAG: hypothetical protein LBD20_08110 [Spirochaetaceae bacterium]|nr:hypothetical protein [Spirochaetaceae bacterium]